MNIVNNVNFEGRKKSFVRKNLKDVLGVEK